MKLVFCHEELKEFTIIFLAANKTSLGDFNCFDENEKEVRKMRFESDVIQHAA
jgi:hypothetical protein